MEAAIVEAAQCLQQGRHAQAEFILEKLQSDDNYHTFEGALQALRQDASSPQGPFTHFVALKLLRFCLIRNRSQWQNQKTDTVQFLFEYAHALGDAVLLGMWKPVVAEWATAVAVVLKLGCVEAGVSPDAVRSVVGGLCSLLSSAVGSSSRQLLARTATQRTVEEFGLFDRSSRYRGVSIPTHRLCRERFEAPGNLSSVACQVAVSLLAGHHTAEAQGSLEAGANALLACVSWSGHRFFEEETSTEESCEVFAVCDPQWDALLLTGVSSTASSTQPVPSATFDSLIRDWWQRAGSGAGRAGVVVPLQLIAELLQQGCGFKGETWTASQHAQFFQALMTLSLDCLDSVLGQQSPVDEELTHCLPSIVGAIARLVASREEMLLWEIAMPLIARLESVTVAVMALESRSGDDDEFVMSSLDELLSTWYHLCGLAQRAIGDASATRGVPMATSETAQTCAPALQCLTNSCVTLFQTYVQGKLTRQGESEVDSNAFVEAFSSSHLHFVAHLGRVNAAVGSRTLSATLQFLGSRLATHSGHLDYCEQLWCVLTIANYFVADPSEGEDPTIPLCFLQSVEALHAVHDLFSAVVACSALYTSAVPSPAVFAAYVEVMRNFVRVYLDPEDPTAAFASVFGPSRAQLVAFAMQLSVETLRRFPLDTDVTAAVSGLLDALGRHNSDVRDTLRQHPAFATLTEYATQPMQFPLAGCTRGRLIAFLLMCSPAASSGGGGGGGDSLLQDVAPILRLFAAERSVRVEDVLELTYALSGVFQSLSRQDVLCALFPFFSGVTQRLLEVAYANFFERQVAIETVRLVRLIFTTSTPLVEDDRVRELLSMVLMTFQSCAASLRTVPAWHSAEAESDRVELLTALAHLITSAAQWMKWDCYLPDSETLAFRTGSVGCLAALFGFLNERSLALPDLEEASFNALKQCADSFPVELTFSADSSTFLTAILYSLHRARVSIQRIGMDVTTSVTACLEAQSSGQANYMTTCQEFFLTLLRGLASGGVYFANTRQLSGSILMAARGMPQPVIDQCFQVVCTESPKCRSVLETVYSALVAALHQEAGGPSAAAGSFEDVLRDSLSSLRGVSLV